MLAFLGVSLLVIVTPGQDTVLTIRNTLLGGRRAGAFTALGVSAGQACWTLAAAAGVAALLHASEPAFTAIKLAGATYLVYLGAQTLWNATRDNAHRDTSASDAVAATLTPPGALRQGFFSNLGNPKMAIFFTSLLPQFASSFLVLLGLGLVFCTLTLCWLTSYAIAVAKANNILRRPRIRRLLDSLTGVFLIAFGLRLATQSR